TGGPAGLVEDGFAVGLDAFFAGARLAHVAAIGRRGSRLLRRFVFDGSGGFFSSVLDGGRFDRRRRRILVGFSGLELAGAERHAGAESQKNEGKAKSHGLNPVLVLRKSSRKPWRDERAAVPRPPPGFLGDDWPLTGPRTGCRD